MGIQEKYNEINKKFSNAGSIINKVLFIVFVLCIALLIIYMFIPNNNKINVVQTDNVPGGTLIECPQTVYASLEKVTITDINVIDRISLINYGSEVLVGPNQKNLVAPITNPQVSTPGFLGNCLADSREVITVTTDNITRIYPLAILDYHIVINDTVGNTPIAVVYTPTSGMINVFKTTVKNSRLIFGHTGSLYKNTDLLVDFSSDTLWSAKTGEALVGMMTGAKLQKIDFRFMNYSRAKTEYPNAQIVTFSTGFKRNYGIDPFIEYKNNNLIPQELSNQSSILSIKEFVLGFTVDNQYYAISTSKIKDQTPYHASIGNNLLTAVYNDGEYILTLNANGESARQISFEIMYWFVWYDYYPATRVL